MKSLQNKESSNEIINYLNEVELEWRRYKWNERSNEMKENRVVIPHILSDNLVEQFFSFIKNERFYPPTKCLSQIFTKLQTQYNQIIRELQQFRSETEGGLNPYAISCLKKEIDRCKKYNFHIKITNFLQMTGVVTEIHLLHKFTNEFVVNLQEKTCQCSLYDQYGILCIHAHKLRQALTSQKVETKLCNLVQSWCLKDFTMKEMNNLQLSPITDIDIEEFNEPLYRELKMKIIDVQSDEVISSKRMRGFQEKSTPSSQLPQRFKKRSKRKFDEIDEEALNGIEDEIEVECKQEREADANDDVNLIN